MLRLPKIQLAALPTPVQHLNNLSKQFGQRILIKRDDLTGVGLGGNKVRKLEYLLSEALNHGAKMVITTGAVQSNHCRQTAAAARKAGLACMLVLVGEEPESATGNLFLDRIFGAEVVFCSQAEHAAVWEQVFTEAWEAGLRPYRIPYGGSNATGAASFSYAFLELLDQIDPPDYIIHATSSGGTQAGLVAGAMITEYQGEIIGISVDPKKEELHPAVLDLANQVCDLVDESRQVADADVLVIDDYIGDGYGIMGDGEIEAIRLFADLEGQIVDPVYTGRCVYGLFDLLRQDYFRPNSSILFWHTGGMPALFAENYRQRILDQIS